MTLESSDRVIVQLVARFKQLTSAQIIALAFPGAASRTSADRALRRLTESGFLARIERDRSAGGRRGGSGQYVYQLGRKGYFTYFDGRYSPARSINYHSLAIADCWVTLKGLERAGVIDIALASTEPDSWLNVGQTELRPDLFVDVTRKATATTYKLWLEVDMGTESQKQVRAQLDSYLAAWRDAGSYEWPGSEWTSFPTVLWVAVDAEREKELRYIIRQLPEGSRKLFRLTQIKTLGNVFLG